MNGIRLAALGAALVLASATVAQAQTAGTSQDSSRRGGEMRGGRGGNPGARVMRAMFRDVSLTDDQKTQIRAINAKYQDERQGLRKDIRDDGVNRADSASMVRFRELQLKEQTEIRGLLTAEQRPAYDRNVAEIRERAKEMRSERRDGRKGRDNDDRDRRDKRRGGDRKP